MNAQDTPTENAVYKITALGSDTSLFRLEQQSITHFDTILLDPGNTGSGGSIVEAAVDDIRFSILGIGIIPGDLNFDQSVDILDVVVMVNFVIGSADPDSNQHYAADLNHDGSIDVLDVVILVNIILISFP